MGAIKVDNNKLEKLETMITKLDDRLDSVDKTLIRNTVSLEQHIKRTDMLEAYVKEKDVSIGQELAPIKNHVNMMTNAIKGIIFFCTVIAGIVSFLVALKKLGL